MFDYIKGKVVEVENQRISILSEIGIAFEIHVLDSTYFIVENIYNVFTYIFHNEESITMYGFLTRLDKFIFSELIKISGIGPKTALNIIRKVTSLGLVSLIRNKDLASMQKISSIGSKADRIYYELKNKVLNVEILDYKYPEVFNALLNLGYHPQKVFKVLDSIEVGLENSDAMKEAIIRLKNEQWTFIYNPS